MEGRGGGRGDAYKFAAPPIVSRVWKTSSRESEKENARGRRGRGAMGRGGGRRRVYSRSPLSGRNVTRVFCNGFPPPRAIRSLRLDWARRGGPIFTSRAFDSTTTTTTTKKIADCRLLKLKIVATTRELTSGKIRRAWRGRGARVSKLRRKKKGRALAVDG